MTEPGLLDLEAVVVGQPRRSRWRTYVGPALVVSTVEGTPLARVTYPDDTYAVLATTSGEFIVGMEQFGPVEFRFIDAEGREGGTTGAPGLIKTLRLSLRTERGRQLLLTRPSLLHAEWQLTETDPEESPAPEILGRVTVSTIDSWLGLQQYVVETDPRLNTSERRTVIASVVCLHLLRRPPGRSATPE
ncbi:hypothetical protein ACIP4X_32865 [Streptomyces sp. NPDC088817]|uniref:hypothetical protein n=1 Tax=Streptomyces sp. NPDC088817 TaxID=3365907 RepID=UPI00381C7CAB